MVLMRVFSNKRYRQWRCQRFTKLNNSDDDNVDDDNDDDEFVGFMKKIKKIKERVPKRCNGEYVVLTETKTKLFV